MKTSKPNFSSSTTTTTTTQQQLVVDITGPWGRWQLQFFVVFIIISIISAWHSLAKDFQAPKIDYWCVDGNNSDGGGSGGVGNDATNQCINQQNQKPCTKWNYDVGHNRSLYHSTIISEWNIVCDRKHWVKLSNSLYFTGSLLATITMAHCSDRFGRKLTLIIGWTIGLVATVSCAFSLNIYHFCLSRFFTAFGMSTIYSTGFVLMLEIVGPQYRDTVGLVVQLGWAAGYITLPLLFRLLLNFRHVLLITGGIHLALALLYRCVTESPRWLLASGRFDEAIKTLKTAATLNKCYSNNNNNNDDNEIEAKIQYLYQQHIISTTTVTPITTATKTYTVLDLFRTLSTARLTLSMYFLWFVNSLLYYTVSININDLGGDAFVNFFLLGVIEVPAYLCCIPAVRRFGQRKVMLATMFGAASGTYALAIFTIESYPILGIVCTLFCKFCVTSSYTIVYLYTPQIFPTVLRTIGLGSSSLVARFGGITAPYVSTLIERTNYSIVMGMIGSLATVAGLCIFPLKEPQKELPDHLEDVICGGGDETKIELQQTKQKDENDNDDDQ